MHWVPAVLRAARVLSRWELKLHCTGSFDHFISTVKAPKLVAVSDKLVNTNIRQVDLFHIAFRNFALHPSHSHFAGESDNYWTQQFAMPKFLHIDENSFEIQATTPFCKRAEWKTQCKLNASTLLFLCALTQLNGSFQRGKDFKLCYLSPLKQTNMSRAGKLAQVIFSLWLNFMVHQRLFPFFRRKCGDN